MTKVLLINPPRKSYDKSAGFDISFPVGLLSVAAMIRSICDVQFLDCLITEFAVRETDDYILYGTAPENIEKRIRDYQPDIIGISIPFTAQAGNAIDVCKLCKKINPGTPVVFGGADASVRYTMLLKETPCDYCVIGEGEETFYEFVSRFNNKQPVTGMEGLAYRAGSGICFKPREFMKELDKLPYPAYDLVDMNAYLHNKNIRLDKNAITVITSRGCPFDCIFCSIKLHMGRLYRYHSPDYIINHLKFLKEKYHISSFHFEDDNVSLNKKRFTEILDRIIGEKLDIKWDTPNGIRADTLDWDVLKKIRQSGAHRLIIAIESGNQNTLNNIIRKKTTFEDIIRVVKQSKRLKIRIDSFYVIGFPGETPATMQETVDFALELFRKYDVFPHLLIATPLYGTDLYKICKENGYIKDNLTDKDFATGTQVYGNPLIDTADFSGKQVKAIAADYLTRLKPAFFRYAVKHPLYSFKMVLRKLKVLNRFLKVEN